MTLSGDREANVLWYCPKSKADLYALMCKHKNDKVRLVAGNTGQGKYKELCLSFRKQEKQKLPRIFYSLSNAKNFWMNGSIHVQFSKLS